MSRTWWWVGLSGAVGCVEPDIKGRDSDSQGSTNLYECQYTETPLALDAAALDTTVSAIAAALDGVFTHAATWADGTPVGATMDLGLTVDAALLREGACGDHIAMPAVAVITTGDGGFDGVTFPFELQVVTGGSIAGWAMIGPDEVPGTWAPRSLEPNETRRGVSLRLEGTVDGPAGSVNDETEGSDGQVAWAASEEVLTLGEGSLATNP